MARAGRRAGGSPPTVIDVAQAAAGYAGTRGAKADKQAILGSSHSAWAIKSTAATGIRVGRLAGSGEVTARLISPPERHCPIGCFSCSL